MFWSGVLSALQLYLNYVKHISAEYVACMKCENFNMHLPRNVGLVFINQQPPKEHSSQSTTIQDKHAVGWVSVNPLTLKWLEYVCEYLQQGDLI